MLINPPRGQDVEWGYAFDVHLNAFFPLLMILHFFQLPFLNCKYIPRNNIPNSFLMHLILFLGIILKENKNGAKSSVFFFLMDKMKFKQSYNWS